MSRLKRPKTPEEEFNLDDWTGGSSSLRGIDDAYRAFTTGPQLVEKKSPPSYTSLDVINVSSDELNTSRDAIKASGDVLLPSHDVIYTSPDLLGTSPDAHIATTVVPIASLDTLPSSLDVLPVSPDITATPLNLPILDVSIAYTVQARPWVHAQDAHSPKEQDLYDEMWRNGKPLDEISRLYSLATPHTAERVRITPRNLIPLYERLVSKLAIVLHKPEDRGRKIPKTWRVFSYKEINARRCRAALTHVIRARNSVTLVTSKTSSDSLRLSGDLLLTSPDTLSTDTFVKSTDNLRKTSGVNLSPVSSLKGNSKFREERPSSSFLLVAAVSDALGTIDDEAVMRIVTRCRDKVPDCTEEEIAYFARISARRIAAMRNIDNPVGLLIVQVPKYFDGPALGHYREEERQRREKAEQAERELAEMAQQCLDDPNSAVEDIQWAQSVLAANE